jgi:hypothetical protein
VCFRVLGLVRHAQPAGAAFSTLADCLSPPPVQARPPQNLYCCGYFRVLVRLAVKNKYPIIIVTKYHQSFLEKWISSGLYERIQPTLNNKFS